MANNFYRNFGKAVKNSKNSSKSSSNKSSSSSNSYLEKSVKKLPAISKIIITFFFIVGVVASFFVCKLICKNDCFEINGTKNISIVVGDEYVDQGVTVIGYGFDLNSRVNIEVYLNNTKLNGLDEINTSEEGFYQIVYTVSSLRFRDVKLIRTVNIVAEELPEEDAVTEPEEILEEV